MVIGSVPTPRVAAPGVEVVDQDSFPMCFPPGEGYSIVTRNIRFFAPYGQTFTPSRDTLAGFDLILSDVDRGDSPETTMVFDIRLGGIGGTFVGSANVTLPDGYGNQTMVGGPFHVDYVPALHVTPGLPYALDVHPSPSEANESWGVAASGWAGYDVYPNGTLIVLGQPYPIQDLCFRSYAVGTPPSEPPTVAFTRPGDRSLLSRTATIAGTSSDPDGSVSRVDVRMDQGPWMVATGTSRWTLDFDTTAVADGPHDITARAFDGTAYSGETRLRVTVDNTPPIVAIRDPAAGAVRPPGDVVVTWNASDATSGIARLEVSLDGGAPREVPRDSRTYTCTNVSVGPHVVTVTAYDSAGNSASASADFTVASEAALVPAQPWSGAPIAIAVLLVPLVAFLARRRRRRSAPGGSPPS